MASRTTHFPLDDQALPQHDGVSKFQPSKAHQRQVKKAAALVPGMTSNALSFPPEQRILVDRGEGAYLFDVDGNERLDWIMGAGASIFGHAYTPLSDHLAAALGSGHHHILMDSSVIELAERLITLIPCAEMVRFTASGSEAILTAHKLARAATGRPIVVKFEGGYHGHLDPLTISLDPHDPDTDLPFSSPRPCSAGMNEGAIDGYRVARYNDIESVEHLFRELPGDIGAVSLEPFQQLMMPSPGFLEQLRTLCDRNGALLVFDEILSGFHTHPGGAQAIAGVTPDIAVFGKALTGGFPQLAAVVGRQEYMRRFDPALGEERVYHCGTYNANPLAVKAAQFTLDELERVDGYSKMRHAGTMIRSELAAIFTRYGVPHQVLGYGAFFNVYFTDHPISTSSDLRYVDRRASARWHTELHRRGVLKTPAKGFLSLAHGDAEMELGMRVAESALKAVS